METLKSYEQAFDIFREKLRNAILNEEIPMEIVENPGENFYRSIYINTHGIKVQFSLGQKSIVYHNKLVEDLFTHEDLKALHAIADKHSSSLTDEQAKAIKFHLAEIEQIRNPKSQQQ